MAPLSGPERAAYYEEMKTAAVLFGTTGTSQALGPDDTTPLSIGVVRSTRVGPGKRSMIAGSAATP